MSNKHEWVNFYYYGTNVEADDAKGKRIKIDERNELLNENINKCYTLAPYKGFQSSFSLLRDGKRVAAVVIQLFYQNKSSVFSENSYVTGFDQEDQETHNRSMMILGKIPTGTSKAAIAYLNGLEIERTQTNKNELVDYFSSELFKHLSKDIGQPILHALVDYDLELVKYSKAKLYAETLKKLPIAEGISFHCFGTNMQTTGMSENRVIAENL
jgi:hypothetical protein